MSEPAVLTERRGRVLIITLNRPDQMNAINGELAGGQRCGSRLCAPDTARP